MYELDEDIDYSDIPPIRDFSKARRNPDFAKQFKDGYTIVEEHEDYDLVITVKKTRRPKGSAVAS